MKPIVTAVRGRMPAAEVTPPEFSCVVAADEARGIGRGNGLPWPRLRGDLAHLKALTSETRVAGARNAVIMGRRTWDTIPRRYQPLPDRLNVVVSRAPLVLPPGAVATRSLEEALAAGLAAGVEQIFVLGGGQIFSQAVGDSRCRYIYYTRVFGTFPSDTLFPAFEEAFVREQVLAPHNEAGVRYQIERWARAERR